MKSSDRPPRKVIPIAAATPDPSAEGEFVSLYEAQKKIYPRSISGYFARWRWTMVFLTQIVFYGLPWLEWGQRQMVLFDLGARRFYIFGLVLYPQDFIYLTGLLIISALSLFLFLFLPTFIVGLFPAVKADFYWRTLLEGILKLVIFFIYLI